MNDSNVFVKVLEKMNGNELVDGYFKKPIANLRKPKRNGQFRLKNDLNSVWFDFY